MNFLDTDTGGRRGDGGTGLSSEKDRVRSDSGIQECGVNEYMKENAIFG